VKYHEEIPGKREQSAGNSGKMRGKGRNQGGEDERKSRGSDREGEGKKSKKGGSDGAKRWGKTTKGKAKKLNQRKEREQDHEWPRLREQKGKQQREGAEPEKLKTSKLNG
jgi:hypothetical protein